MEDNPAATVLILHDHVRKAYFALSVALRMCALP
jgi:hypothetical protein